MASPLRVPLMAPEHLDTSDPTAFSPLEDTFPQLADTGPRMTQVLDFNPQEGEEGAPITVRIHFHSESPDPIHVRLVIGNKAVSTAVRELEGYDYGRWQLDATAPALDRLTTVDNKVLITVQALNADNVILDSVPVGEFSYWEGGVKPNLDIVGRSPPMGRRRAATYLPTPSPHYSIPSPSLSDSVRRSKTRSRKREVYKSIKGQSLVRARQHAPGELDENLHAHTPMLEIVTPLDSVCCGWDAAELRAGRRLVRFQKVQDGRRVILSCEAITQEEYCDTDIVISCIYREEAETCFVTSVDIIYLLERLTNDEFPVEEKNRIRRNLEGLRPTTISKHKPGSEEFFQRIMDFPDPKPRNIEKDLKVFEWTLLGQALEKIMSKYSIYTSSPTDSTTSLPVASSPDVLHPPGYVLSHVDPTLVDEKGPLPGSLLFSSHPFTAQQPPITLPPLVSGRVKEESDSTCESILSDSFHKKDSGFAFDLSEHGDASNYDDGLNYIIRDDGMWV